ncbi:putative cytokinin 7-beta-glucosyltransferase [Helianthus annuus]|nr:putative cytokinin 7-beta-glucosyltransferase [Helianthus annuus]KAJ0541938.1 putative cytokinin 7-beta-glucosyltransferase [Helianthus annuus]KAJ0887652.1 putative cytokinin 7-beta-glucosyltransferase [Helianthus annuus]KAJ0892616.1 putative cytokinin 7-beta-glucosyltransferase [Helianthus annuus]
MDITTGATIPTPSLTTSNRRRLVLLPYPLQGHINPMLQLASILHSKGFSITILHTRFNAPDPTNHPHFNFMPIPGVAEEKLPVSGTDNLIRLMRYLNDEGLGPIRGCLEQLLSEDSGVASLITDAQWFAVQTIADGLELPRIVNWTTSVSSFLSFSAVPILRQMGYFRRLSDDMKSEALVTGVEPLKVRDVSRFLTSDPEGAGELMEILVQGMKPAQAIIWNTFKELEELQLPNLTSGFPNRHFMIGPFHKYFPALSSSLLTQDKTCMSWLDKQEPNSVLYVSFGSLAGVEESEFLEIAWGLANSKQSFLWVVRPRSVKGSEWLEALPDGFLERIVKGRGYIVKWAPQLEVLTHRSIGGFWTHNGWNSTLESICEGVPMICSPSFADQLPIARNVSDVWKIGVELKNGFERGEIESAIKTLMVDKMGLEMRDRIMNLKEKVNLCLKKGGSSYSSLEDLANYILSY